MAAELDQLVGQFRYEAALEEVGSGKNGSGSIALLKPGKRIPYRQS